MKTVCEKCLQKDRMYYSVFTAVFILWITVISPIFAIKENTRCDDFRGSKNNRINCTANGVVTCLEGWTGDFCNKAVCRDDCHSIHGYCTQPGECKCALGWRGKNCDECVPLPGCKHGFCSNTSYECICQSGWEGSYCSIPVCREGCNSARGYCKLPGECRCRIGWGGETCDACKPLPGCLNGFCTKPLECRCREGWTGEHCETPICSANCSTEHGTCTKPGECRCQVGWWGKDCETCFPYPGCKHGTCQQPWECNCKPGWKGITCQEKEEGGTTYCDRHQNKCRNGGTCINVPDDRNYTCSCPSLFTGQHCEYLANSRASFFPIINIISRGSSVSKSTSSAISRSFPVSRPDTSEVATVINLSSTSPESTSIDPTTTTSTTTTTQSSTTTTETAYVKEPPLITSHSNSSASEITSVPSTAADSTVGSKDNAEDNETYPVSSKMTLRVTKVKQVNKNLTSSLDSKSEEISKVFQNNEKSKLPKDLQRGTETESVHNQSSQNMEVKALKSLNLAQSMSSMGGVAKVDKLEKSLPFTRTENAQQELFDIEKLYSEIAKAFDSQRIDDKFRPKTQTPVVILQLQQSTEDLKPQAKTDAFVLATDADSRISGKSTVSHDQNTENPPKTENLGSHSFFPFLVAQEVPQPSGLGSSPYIVATDFDSLSQATSLYPYEEYADLPPQTRINRRTSLAPNFINILRSPLRGKSPKSSRRQNTAAITVPVPKDDNKDVPKLSYYEENYAGRVHIGDVTEVDKHAPLQAIVDAFIELKKLKR